MSGPAIRSDIVEVYVFRRGASVGVSKAGITGVEFLQVRRVAPPAAGSWQPVMGHVEATETAAQAAQRELREETGYRPGHGLLALWQLELVNTFYLAARDVVMMCPGFAVEVAAGLEPRLDETHDAARWIRRDAADRAFLWPGQRRAIEHIARDILPHDSEVAPLLRIDVADEP